MPGLMRSSREVGKRPFFRLKRRTPRAYCWPRQINSSSFSAAAIQINFLTQGRREKEDELIWRGHQYARGVRLFYRKNGRFPTSLDDLSKPGIGVLYMRKAYKEPMNTVDGSWRLLYVGPAGQIIGSVKANLGGSIFPAAPAPGGAQAGTTAAPP